MNAVGRARLSSEELIDVVGDGALPRCGGDGLGGGGEELDVGLGRQFSYFEDGACAAGCKEGQEYRNLE